MKIDLTELLHELGNQADVAAEERFQFSEDGLVLTRPVKISLHLVNTGTSVLVNGSLETEAEQECSRCLEKYRAPLTAQLAEEYVEEYAKDKTLDLDETIRQNLLLALPIKPLCKAECKGV